MNERELYELWRRRAVAGARFIERDGKRVMVVSPGRRNRGAGPDFLDAVLLIDGVLRVGSIEMHVREREWFAHRHHHDDRYDDVILHVVASIESPRLLEIPTASIDAIADEPIAVDAAQPGAVPELLVELGWARLLRRTVLFLRERSLGEYVRPRSERLLAAMFDALGYAANRTPMRCTARLWLNAGHAAAGDFHTVAATLAGVSGIDLNAFIAEGQRFAGDDRLIRIRRIAERHRASVGDRACHQWRYDQRPANRPQRRLWAAARLALELFRAGLADDMIDTCAARGSLRWTIDRLRTRLGDVEFVGEARAREIAVNAVAPFALAEGIATGDRAAIEGACRAYRNAPPLARNAVVRQAETFLGVRIAERGGFWHQGAMEFQQRYRQPDRTRLSFASEPQSSWFPSGRQDYQPLHYNRRNFHGQ